MTISNGWTTPVIQAILSADRGKRIYHRAWHRANAATDGALVCSYCLATLDPQTPRQSVIDYLVPLQLGGPPIDENRVLSCPSCARSKGTKDLVSWKEFASLGTETSRSALLVQRSQVLALAPNHLTDTRPNAPKAVVLRELEKRWANPRFTVYALHGSTRSFIGWTSRNGAKEALGLAAALLRFSCEAVPLSSGKVVLYELPSGLFLDAVWVLIEHHGLVKKLEVEGLEPAPYDPDNWQHHWAVHLEFLSDLCRRRPRKVGNNARSRGTKANAKMRFFAHGTLPSQDQLMDTPVVAPAPRKPKEFSKEPRSIARRERNKANAIQAKLHAYTQARAVLDDFKERVRQGRVDPPTARELDWMEREVLALL